VKKLLIVQVGDPVPQVKKKRGPFSDWIIKGMGLTDVQVEVCDPRNGAPLPAPNAYRGVIVTGSSALVTDREEWSERTSEWLIEVVNCEVPYLGICYGHQLLAHGLGGEVGRNPNGREIGSIEVMLTSQARNDPLFESLPSPLRVQATHVESVLKLPEGARILGYSDRDPHQAFIIGKNAWAVQFHPEFDADIVRGYVDARSGIISEEGLSPDAIKTAVKESDHGKQLLLKFAALFM